MKTCRGWFAFQACGIASRFTHSVPVGEAIVAKLTAAAKTPQPITSGSCTPEDVLHACGRKAASALTLGGAHASF
jgi:hypothetical protein